MVEERFAEPLSSGDRVRLTGPVDSLPSGAIGVVVGFVRRDTELIVVKFAEVDGVVRVQRDEIERVDR
jgi:hypothetical protein